MIKVVFDTNVLVAAVRSQHGASFQLLRAVGPEAAFRLAVSVPLVLEYEMVLKRRTHLTEADAEVLVDYICQVAEHRQIHFLWRPFLKDPADEMVLELAVEAEAEAIITHNARDFVNVDKQFGIEVLDPGSFLRRLEEKKQ